MTNEHIEPCPITKGDCWVLNTVRSYIERHTEILGYEHQRGEDGEGSFVGILGTAALYMHKLHRWDPFAAHDLAEIQIKHASTSAILEVSASLGVDTERAWEKGTGTAKAGDKKPIGFGWNCMAPHDSQHYPE